MNLRVDLRDIAVSELSAAVASFSNSVTFLITAWQWSAWKPAGSKNALSHRMMVMTPDFLYYARLVSTGQAKEIIKLPASTRSLIQTGLACISTGIAEFPRLARGEFWAGAEALLTYDLGLLERGFKGQVILHYNISDFAWLFENHRFIDAYKRKASRRSGWGIATQQINKGLSCSSRWNAVPDCFMYTPGYSRPEAMMIELARRHQFSNTTWILDLTQWPTELLCGAEIHNMHREFDSEWLLNYQAAKTVCEQS